MMCRAMLIAVWLLLSTHPARWFRRRQPNALAGSVKICCRLLLDFVKWWTRCIVGLSLVLLVFLLHFSFTGKDVNVDQNEHHREKLPLSSASEGREAHRGLDIFYSCLHLTWPHLFFVLYTFLVHFASLVFPLRAIRAVRDLTMRLQSLKSRPLSKKNITSFDFPDTALLMSEYDADDETGDELVLHAVVLPNYKEEMHTLRETLHVLASHIQAKQCYDVYLAMEEREEGAILKADRLVSEYRNFFHSMDYTVHPKNIPGEAPGKSSNQAWAVDIISMRYRWQGVQQDVIVTVMDADSHLLHHHFSQITTLHLSYPETADTTIYVPPIIFDRNSHQVPRLVRMADLLWCAAGLSGLHHSSTIAPPTSVYSLPLTLINRVGGWDASPEAIGEDLHMYMKCFFALGGNLTCRHVISPASQTNVAGNGKTWRGLVNNLIARYKQALRHMWGMLDTGYSIRQCTGLFFGYNEMEHELDYNRYIGHAPLDDQPDESPPLNLIQIIRIFTRLFEAHFLPVHLTSLILFSSLYTYHFSVHATPFALLCTFWVTGYLRIVGYLLMLIYFHFYMNYFRTSLQLREREMRAAGLAGYLELDVPDLMAGFRGYVATYTDFLLFPVAGILFGTIPAVHAQVAHFVTVRLTYTVSLKPSQKR